MSSNNNNNVSVEPRASTCSHQRSINDNDDNNELLILHRGHRHGMVQQQHPTLLRSRRQATELKRRFGKGGGGGAAAPDITTVATTTTSTSNTTTARAFHDNGRMKMRGGGGTDLVGMGFLKSTFVALLLIQQTKSTNINNNNNNTTGSIHNNNNSNNHTNHSMTISSSSSSSPLWWHSVAAGYAAGVTGTLVGHPLDSIKVWLQTSQRPVAAATQNTIITSSSLPATPWFSSSSWSTLWRQGRVLYNGVGAPLLTVGLIQSINFGLMDTSRRLLYEAQLQRRQQQQQQQVGGGCYHQYQHETTRMTHDYRHSDSVGNIVQASVITGALIAAITAPLLLIKTQQQVYGTSFWQAIQHITGSSLIMHNKGGWWRLWQYGLVAPHIVAEILGRMVYFTSYEMLKRYPPLQLQTWTTYRRGNNISSDDTSSSSSRSSCMATTSSSSSSSSAPSLSSLSKSPPMMLSLADRMFAASVAGILSWTVVFPLDAIRSRLYAMCVPPRSLFDNNHIIPGMATTTTTTTTTHGQYHNHHHPICCTIRMARHMYQHGGGIHAFVKGWGITVLRAGPVAAVVLPVYDATLDLLQQ